MVCVWVCGMGMDTGTLGQVRWDDVLGSEQSFWGDSGEVFHAFFQGLAK